MCLLKKFKNSEAISLSFILGSSVCECEINKQCYYIKCGWVVQLSNVFMQQPLAWNCCATTLTFHPYKRHQKDESAVQSSRYIILLIHRLHLFTVFLLFLLVFSFFILISFVSSFLFISLFLYVLFIPLILVFTTLTPTNKSTPIN